MTKKIDYYFAYVYSKSRDGEITYLHSAPRLGINPPIQDYWLALAHGESPMHHGGIVYSQERKANA
jgi:hypothetical protein